MAFWSGAARGQKKWHTSDREVQVGDLVLIQDLNLVRGQWKRGEVVKTFRSLDQKVRSVKLRYKILWNSYTYEERGIILKSEM